VLRAIVFDFDGVIANSEPLHLRAYRDVLAGYGVALTETDYYACYLGFDDQGAFEAIAADAGAAWPASQIREMIRLKARRLEELERDGSVLFPGVPAAIQTAADAVPIAIASGALGAEIRRVLDRANLTRYFATIVAAEDTPASKPSPDPYLLAVARLSARLSEPVPAGQCVAVEDSRWGLASAKAAGLRTVAVAHTYSADALAPADLIIPSMGDFDINALRRLF
jgi:beta-phosphoglucomutase-like phosphatase (HAD superfamily)